MPANEWPQPKFHFHVTIGDAEMFFTEISGLDSETQVIKYRAGNSKTFSTIKMPGLHKVGNIRLKRGVFKNANIFSDFNNAMHMNAMKKETAIIQLIDEKGNVAMTWQLINAFPVKITGSDLNASGNEVAIESLELAHEGLTISNS